MNEDQESVQEMIARISATSASDAPSVSGAHALMAQLSGMPAPEPSPVIGRDDPRNTDIQRIIAEHDAQARSASHNTPQRVVAVTSQPIDDLLAKLSTINVHGRSPSSYNPITPTYRRTGFEAEVEQQTPFRVDQLSPDQLEVYHPMLSWCQSAKSGLRTFAGFAGTGKTTLVGLLANTVTRTRQVAFSAYTGKAAGVMRRKLTAQGVETSRFPDRGERKKIGTPIMPYAGTIHSLMYTPEEDEAAGRITGWVRQSELPYDLIVVDEASMVTRQIFKDLSEYRVPILAVGDHGQLPPISDSKGDGREDFGLMADPFWKLEEIHRQAAWSPIITLGKLVRENGGLPRSGGFDGKGRVQLLDLRGMQNKLEELYMNGQESIHDIAVLTYMNQTRQNVNMGVRAVLGRSGAPVEGDQVVCLRNTDAVIFNGMRGVIVSPVTEHDTYWYNATIAFPDENIEVEGSFLKGQVGRSETFKDWDAIQRDTGFRPRSKDQVGLLLDYGYALTVHKFQGSQAKHVFVVLERPGMVSDEHYARWLYTAVSRASDYLYLVMP